MTNSRFKKIFGTMILICLLSTINVSPFVETKKANATIPTIDWANIAQTTMTAISTGLSRIYAHMISLKEYVLDNAAYYLARILIRQLTQSIVDWINSGFNGNPSFLEDPKDFLRAGADRTIGELIYDTDLRFLCKPFEINVRLALGLQYSPFQDKVRCRLSDVLVNSEGAVTETYNKFMNGDFIGGGGWDTWLQVTTVPQNNQLGAMLIAQAELDARLDGEEKQKSEELSWGGGLLSQKQCEQITYNADGTEKSRISYTGDARFPPTQGQTSAGDGIAYSSSTYNIVSSDTYSRGGLPGTPEYKGSVKQVCKIVTPGSLTQDLLQKAVGADLAQLQVADEINEIVGALGNYVVTKVMQSGKGLLGQKDRDRAADDAAWRQGIADLTTQQKAQMSSGVQSGATNDSSGINNILNSTYNADITPGYSGVGSVNDVATDANGVGVTLSQAKQILQTRISGHQQTESNYYSYNSGMYNLATTTSNKINSVIACYNQKIASSTPALTSSQRSFAETRVTQLSGALTDVNAVTTSTAPNISSALSNMSSLNTLSSSVSNAGDVTALNNISASLDSLIPTLHNASTTEIARNVSSTTVSWLGPVLNNANTLGTECQAFPS
jgi:hypothetical protein